MKKDEKRKKTKKEKDVDLKTLFQKDNCYYKNNIRKSVVNRKTYILSKSEAEELLDVRGSAVSVLLEWLEL